jgi:hypothetical protein
MLGFLLLMARTLDKLTKGRITRIYLKIVTISNHLVVATLGNLVRKAVGSEAFEEARRLKVVSFPNRLVVPDDVLEAGYMVEKILRILGIKPHQFSPWEDFDVIINWQDLTTDFVDTKGYVQTAYRYTRRKKSFVNSLFVNIGCRDISKKTVGALNFEVFGYPLDLDPVNHEGLAVRKSNDNATHDGEVIICPIRAEDVETSHVYSFVIDNSDGQEVIDYRVPYFMGLVGFCYEKRRPASTRFSNENSHVRLRELRSVFSSAEMTSIEKFAAKLGADYGEFDVLRDFSTGRVFIVDFAKTPWGPPNGLPRKESHEAITRLSTDFVQKVLANTRSARQR